MLTFQNSISNYFKHSVRCALPSNSIRKLEAMVKVLIFLFEIFSIKLPPFNLSYSKAG